MIPLAIPDVSGNEAKYLKECIDTNFVSSVGSFVSKLEEMVATAAGAAKGVAVSSGTCGLHLALTALGVKHNDLVILPSFTFIASANAISHAGASPLLIDVKEDSWTIDADLLEKFLTKECSYQDNKLILNKTSQRIACIMPVYTLGNPADMDNIKKIADKYKLPVVADAAAALGAKHKGRNLGELADLTVFSFNGNKTITSGGGGMIIGNNEKLLDHIKHLSTTARAGFEYDHDEVGFNYRLTNIQAAVGCAQMERLDHFVRRKIDIYNKYKISLNGLEFCKPFPVMNNTESAHWFSGFIYLGDKNFNVVDLTKKFAKDGVMIRPFWKPIHLQKPYKDCQKSTMFVAEKIWNKIVTLPCSTSLTEDEQNKVIEVVKKHF